MERVIIIKAVKSIYIYYIFVHTQRYIMKFFLSLALLFAIVVVGGASASVSGGIPASSVLAALFKALGITDVDVSTCVADISGFEQDVRDFGVDFKNGNYTIAIESSDAAFPSPLLCPTARFKKLRPSSTLSQLPSSGQTLQSLTTL